MPTDRRSTLPPARWAMAAALFVGTLALGAGAYRLCFLGGETFEFCQYGEIASNLLGGRGFTTATYYPCTLAYLARQKIKVGATGPVVDRFPLQAGLVALSEALLGRADRAVAAANIAAHAGWVALIYLGGLSLVGPGAALAAAALWALDPMLLAGFDLRGYPDLLFGFFFLAMNLAFFRGLEEERRPGLSFAAGLLGGFCYLARYSFVLLLPAYLLSPFFLRPARGRWKEAGLYLAGFFLPVGLWFLYAAESLGAGSPPLLLWNLALDTIGGVLPWCDYRVYALRNFLHPAVAAALSRKWLAYFLQFLRDLPHFWFAFPLFPWALIGLWKPPRVRGGFFTRGLAGLLLWTAVCFSFLRYEDLGLMNGRYYLGFAPVLLYAAVGGMNWAASRWPKWGRALWALGLGLPLLYWLSLAPRLPTRIDHPSGAKVGRWPEIAYFKDHPSSEWVVTNLPTQLAWYAGLKTVALPNLPPGVRQIERDYPVGYVYLSFTRVGEWTNYPAWRALVGGYAGGVGRFCEKLGYEVVRSDSVGILLRKKGQGEES